MSEHDENPQISKLRRAVALKYDPFKTNAPKVIGKGTGELAERILETAQSNGIPIQEDQSLVEVLSKLDIDQQIPTELFEVVAEILSFIYRADRAAKDWPI